MRLLIIEDDPMVAMIHQEYCKKIAAFDIKHVTLLSVAKESVTQFQPDIILMDNYLPDGKGVDVLQYIRHIPVIMITAASDNVSIHKAFHNGVVDYLVKPFTFERFELAIEKAIKYVQLLNASQVTQQHIDHYFYGQRDTFSELTLPKGLTKVTLSKIIDAIFSQNEPFTTQMISDELAISRITIKKYLNFLVSMQFLKEDADYLTLGRPVSVYTIDNAQQAAIVLERLQN